MESLRSPPFSLSSSSPDGLQCSLGSVFNPPTPGDNGLQTLSSNLESLISPDIDDVFSDALLYVSGRSVPVHRCILAARCRFFKALFSKNQTQLASFAPEPRKHESTKLTIDLHRLFDPFPNGSRVGYDAFIIIIGYIYSGKLNIPVVKCIDDGCLHEACLPVAAFAVEMLCLSSMLDIPELKTFWQHYLLNMVEKAQVDEVLGVLVAAEVHGGLSLLSLCKRLVAISNIDTVDLEKQLPLALAAEVIDMRLKLGLLQTETLNPVHEKERQRIRKALDSDDVELVQLLLEEGRVNLDEAHALHYAAAYCDPHTVHEILELALADPNLRNNRGFTVLHVASMRRDPVILVSLLTKGANPLDLTPDGRTALQLCKRLIRSIYYQKRAEDGEELQKDRLSVELLDQAGKKNPFADPTFPPVVNEKELFMRLLYLENRVAVGRLLFPQEAKLVTGISHLEATSEFTGLCTSDLGNKVKSEAGVDLNQLPLDQISLGPFPGISSSQSIPQMNEALRKRVQALQKTVELGKRIFPCCTTILDNFMDDDLSELMNIERGIHEDETKKRRYNELKEVLKEAFRKDVAAMDRHKPEKLDIQRFSSSSSSQ